MTSLKPTSADRCTRWDLLVLAALVVTAVLLALLVVNAPSRIGQWHDDGVYLVTAKSLADGRGYRHLELPTEPHQTKYPILYPLLLSAIWRLFPAFPENGAVVRIVNVALWAIGSWLAYRLLRRVWEVPWWLAASGVLLAFAHPATLGLLETAMAEPLFFVLYLGALLLLAPAHSAEIPATSPSHRAGLGRAAFAGLLAAAAYLTRSIGITLIVALVADALLRRRWRQGAVVALLGGLGIGGWRAWCLHAATVNAMNPGNIPFRYDLEYGAWVPASAGTILWIAYQNSSALLLDYFDLTVKLPARSRALVRLGRPPADLRRHARYRRAHAVRAGERLAAALFNDSRLLGVLLRHGTGVAVFAGALHRADAAAADDGAARRRLPACVRRG